MQNRIYRQLPDIIKSILLTSEGWLVGSALGKIKEGKHVTDYDIIVPSRELFQIVAKQLDVCSSTKLNSFGGFNFKVKSLSEKITNIDLWCEELDHFLKTANKKDFAFNMKRNIFLTIE